MRKKKLAVTAGSAFALFAIAACDKETIKGRGGPAGPPTFATIQSRVLQPSCVECHSGAMIPHGVDLGSFEALAAFRGFPPLIVPGKPEESSLYQSLVNPDPAKRMPKNRAPLTDEQKKLVYEWIRLGATKDGTATPPPGPGTPPPGTTDPDEPCDRARWGDDEPGYKACS